jgi:hypothetical protein
MPPLSSGSVRPSSRGGDGCDARGDDREHEDAAVEELLDEAIHFPRP